MTADAPKPRKPHPSWGQIAALFLSTIILGPSLCAATFASKLDSDTQVIVAVIIGIVGTVIFFTSIVYAIRRGIRRLRGRS
jgi:O-antigen/teichoic acid export membrane protein